MLFQQASSSVHPSCSLWLTSLLTTHHDFTEIKITICLFFPLSFSILQVVLIIWTLLYDLCQITISLPFWSSFKNRVGCLQFDLAKRFIFSSQRNYNWNVRWHLMLTAGRSLFLVPFLSFIRRRHSHCNSQRLLEMVPMALLSRVWTCATCV